MLDSSTDWEIKSAKLSKLIENTLGATRGLLCEGLCRNRLRQTSIAESQNLGGGFRKSSMKQYICFLFTVESLAIGKKTALFKWLLLPPETSSESGRTLAVVTAATPAATAEKAYGGVAPCSQQKACEKADGTEQL